MYSCSVATQGEDLTERFVCKQIRPDLKNTIEPVH